MSKYLLCFEIEREDGGLTSGHGIYSMPDLTEANLKTSEELCLANVKTKHPELVFKKLVWRSATKLDDQA